MKGDEKKMQFLRSRCKIAIKNWDLEAYLQEKLEKEQHITWTLDKNLSGRKNNKHFHLNAIKRGSKIVHLYCNLSAPIKIYYMEE